MIHNINCGKKILTFGLVGIIGVLLTIISDFILIGRPNSAYSFLKLGTESMAEIAQWRITIGSFIGIFVLPFQIAGLIPIYYGLKPSGRFLPFIVVLSIAHIITIGVAFHISYAFIGSGWKLFYKLDTGAFAAEIIDKFHFYWILIIFIIVAELFFSSVIYVYLILKGNTLYPKWAAAFNPLCILFIMFPVIFILPAPIGGFVAPAYFNISTLFFYSFTILVIYKKLNNIKEYTNNS